MCCHVIGPTLLNALMFYLYHILFLIILDALFDDVGSMLSFYMPLYLCIVFEFSFKLTRALRSP